MTTAPRVLIAEDDVDISDLIRIHLNREGYQVESFSDGLSALQRAVSGDFRALLLDWMLPKVSGLEITKEVRKKISFAQCGILMLTARSSESDIILGLESGADDYLTKPFEVPILMARVRALIRRTEGARNPAKENLIRVGQLEINLASHEVFCSGNPLSLTPYEFKLLQTLLLNRGRVLTRDQLIAEVQGQGVAVVERAIDTHVFGLRKKLNSCSEIIETVRGVGYRIVGNAQ